MNYQELKPGKFGIPSWDGMMAPTLTVARRKDVWKRRDLVQKVLELIELPAELREKSIPGKPDTNVAEDRVGWALSDLSISGLLKRPKRGVYAITQRGQEMLDQYGVKLNSRQTHDEPLYKSYIRERDERKGVNRASIDTHVIEPSEESNPLVPNASQLGNEINAKINQYNADVADELLARIRSAEPTFFENLVVNLLSKMGYQGANGNAMVTPSSHDGGIDGIINQDPLGTRTVYLQAKRYQADNNVQRPAIDEFYGALSRVHADRGVFITTSDFSSAAVADAKQFSIVLINGVQLTDLMLKYQVGVQSKQTYELFTIDEDYFDEELD
jgi:restriction system protein